MSLVYPPSCGLCGALEIVDDRRQLCGRCVQHHPSVLLDVCLHCGLLLGPYVGRQSSCIECPKVLPFIKAVASAGDYRVDPPVGRKNETNDIDRDLANDTENGTKAGESEEPGPLDSSDDEGGSLLSRGLRKLKFGGATYVAPTIGRMIADEVKARSWGASIDWVVPVPLSWRRQMGRRFNQAERLATVAANELGRPMVEPVVRTRSTPPQTALSRAGRLKNVEGAFALRSPLIRWWEGLSALRGSTILLVDDVMTTGVTLSEVARALQPLHPKAIYAAVGARVRRRVRHRYGRPHLSEKPSVLVRLQQTIGFRPR